MQKILMVTVDLKEKKDYKVDLFDIILDAFKEKFEADQEEFIDDWNVYVKET